MGYQIILVRDTVYVVLNATVAAPLSEIRERRYSANEYRLLSGNVDSAPIRGLRPLDYEGPIDVVFSNLDPAFQRQDLNLAFSQMATTPPVTLLPPKVPRAYYRFCAYRRDKRVDSTTGEFLAGTYATTFADLHFVPSGFAAVGRYALPNPASARFVFQIVTMTRPILVGTAAPNYGQAGGGVEVLFSNGATHDTGFGFPIQVG